MNDIIDSWFWLRDDCDDLLNSVTYGNYGDLFSIRAYPKEDNAISFGFII